MSKATICMHCGRYADTWTGMDEPPCQCESPVLVTPEEWNRNHSKPICGCEVYQVCSFCDPGKVAEIKAKAQREAQEAEAYARTLQLNVTVADGKYTVQQTKEGHLRALRYGLPWRDCCGDNLIMALATELAEAREKLEELCKVTPKYGKD